MDRIYQPPLPALSAVIAAAADLPTLLSETLTSQISDAERACFDRYFRILDSIETNSLVDPSLLDIGCANGFFAYLFAVTTCRQVTAVDDARGSSCGYSDNAFLAPLHRAKREYGLEHLEIVGAPIEQFLTECPDRQWDIVLCLSVLHHFYTGYGDHQVVEDAVAVDDLEAAERAQRGRVVQIAQLGFRARIPLFQHVQAILPGVNRNDRAPALHVKSGVIARTGAELEYPPVREG